MAQINTLFHSVQGSWSTFLYTDPYSNTALLTSFGTGNASTSTFQLLDIEGYPIYYTNSTPSIYVNGTLQTVTTNYTISATGLVTFVAAPASSATITWSGTYYRQVRFDMDEFELSQIVNLAWGKGTIKLVSIK